MRPKNIFVATSNILSVVTILCSICALPAFAQIATYSHSSSSIHNSKNSIHSSNEVPFERLFTTPEQRTALDYARLHGVPIHPQFTGIDESLASPKETQVPQPTKLMGVLLRADGKNKIWLNGVGESHQNTINNRPIAGSILQSANVKVPLRELNTGAILKPGQVWNPIKGKVEEAYQLPVSKPIIVEPVANPKLEKSSSSAVSSTNSSAQISSVNASEVHSSVKSGTK